MTWWIWMVLGLLLLVAEVFIPLDFFLFFIGLALTLTGLLSYFEIITEIWLQWSTAGFLSVVLLFLVRKPLLAKLHASGTDRPEDLIGDSVEIVSDIQSGQTGKGKVRGSDWKIQNNSSQTLAAGKSYPVSRKDGIILIIED